MDKQSETSNCPRNCWLLAVVAGLLFALFFMMYSGWGFFAAVLIGALFAIVAGMLLNRICCGGSPATDDAARTSSAPGTASGAPDRSAPVPAPAPEPAPVPAPAPEPAPVPAPAPEPAPVPAPAPEPAPVPAPAAGLKPSAVLPGQQELAARKGNWRYQGNGAGTPAPASEAGAEGARPAALDAPREGGADDLKLIKGIGPKLEGVLNGIGIYHFDQIAAWSEAEVAWADQNLVGFKGRVSRDEWVKQAKILAAGGETEFSRRNA